MDGEEVAPGVALVPAPEAPAGASDATRRWALRLGDGVVRFPGLARPEAARAAPQLSGMGPEGWARALLEVRLPVVLSDDAGPHLLDAAGRLVLGLGPHPAVGDALVAMGEARPHHAVGAVRRRGEGPVWSWLARADVPPARRVEALDALAAAGGEGALGEWQRRWGRIGSGTSPPGEDGAT